MFEFSMRDLKPGDEFTTDEEETWYEVVLVENGSPITGAGNDLVVVK